MLEIKGKYGNTKIFNNNVENQALSQVYELLCQEFTKDSSVRIMPDCHKGTGAPIGLTMTIDNKLVVPNLVGVDIGCGMEVIKFKNTSKFSDLSILDKIIHENIPAGFNVNDGTHKYLKNVRLGDLRCDVSKMGRVELSLGSLGGGNHFIEVNKDDEDNLYIVIHSGSRNLGKQVCEYYQDLAYKQYMDLGDERKEIIEKCKREGRGKDIPKELSLLGKEMIKIPKPLTYVIGKSFDDYINDMIITQEFALWNRKAMMNTIIEKMGLTVDEQFTTIHNYIETDLKIPMLRKGAISAKLGEQVIIPMNMRDGSLICIGKGNEDWNFSAPHGAGRLMSRSKAKDCVNIGDYKETMKDVYSTCVNTSTLDESPFVYKPMEEIIENMGDTVDIVKIIKPIYNFKSN